ncbi:MAG TPA: hypothetical protein VIL37_16660 [Natronosporangium sp.]
MAVSRGQAKVIVAGLSCLAVAGAAGVLLRDRVPPLDQWLLEHFRAPGDSVSAQAARAVTGLGTLLGLAVLAVALVGVWRSLPAGRLRLLVRAGLVLLICAATATSQAAFQRLGPPVVAEDWTYPSGTGVTVGAMAVTAVVLAYRLSTGWRATVLAAGVAAMVMVSIGRIAVGEHYLLDMAGAALIVTGAGLLVAGLLGLLPAARTTAIAASNA